MKIQLNKKMIGMLLIAASFTAISCTSKNKGTENSNTIETGDSPTPISNAQDVSFKDENGKEITLSSLKGKVVFINFWATWCPPCIHEMPSIDNLKKSFNGNDNIVFLMVDVDGTLEKSKAFMTDNNYDLQVYIPNGEIPTQFLGNAIPTTVILDKKGNLVNRMEGGRDYADPEINKNLQELIQSN